MILHLGPLRDSIHFFGNSVDFILVHECLLKCAPSAYVSTISFPVRAVIERIFSYNFWRASGNNT